MLSKTSYCLLNESRCMSKVRNNKNNATQKILGCNTARVNNPFQNPTDALLMLLYENFMST